MDKIDQKIISLLDIDGRMFISEIAKKATISKETALYRFNRLEKQGILGVYYPLLNTFALDLITARVYFDLEEMNPTVEKEFVEALDKQVGASFIFKTDYPYKYGILLWEKSIYDIEKKIKQLKLKFNDVINEYNFSILCSYKQYSRNYLSSFKSPKSSFLFKPVPVESVDEYDLKILRQLSKNARATTLEISRLTKIPQTTVSNKIKSMEKKKILLGYRADINIEKLGYINYFMEIYLNDSRVIPSIESWADGHKNVIWLQKIIGNCDIELEIEVKSRKDMENLLNDLRIRFPQIRKMLFWQQEYKKITYSP